MIVRKEVEEVFDASYSAVNCHKFAHSRKREKAKFQLKTTVRAVSIVDSGTVTIRKSLSAP